MCFLLVSTALPIISALSFNQLRLLHVVNWGSGKEGEESRGSDERSKGRGGAECG